MDVKLQNEMLTLYLDQMNEIKRRHITISNVFSKRNSTTYRATDLEFIALQMRMSLELIALGNLVMNKNKYNEMYKRFANDWNARLILKDIERINPDFYPKPVLEIPLKDKPGVNDIVDRKDGFLTKEEFISLYEKMGGILHARNPYATKIDYSLIEKSIPVYIDKIMKLLNSHYIQIFDGYFFLIHMKENGKETASGYIFEKT